MTRTLDELRASEVWDSRDAIERIDELEDLESDDTISPEDLDELKLWRDFLDDNSLPADWHYGEAFIADDYFENHARELAEDMGAIDRNATWPLSYIDWPAAARALKMDYTEYDLDGYTFWARS